MDLREYIIQNHLDEAIEGYMSYMDGTDELQQIIDEYENTLPE